MNVSFTSSAGWMLTGKPGNFSHARLPVPSERPKGVSSRRMKPKLNIVSHFHFFTTSDRSTMETSRYSTTPSTRAQP